MYCVEGYCNVQITPYQTHLWCMPAVPCRGDTLQKCSRLTLYHRSSSVISSQAWNGPFKSTLYIDTQGTQVRQCLCMDTMVPDFTPPNFIVHLVLFCSHLSSHINLFWIKYSLDFIIRLLPTFSQLPIPTYSAIITKLFANTRMRASSLLQTCFTKIFLALWVVVQQVIFDNTSCIWCATLTELEK